MGCDIHAMIEIRCPHDSFPESTYEYWHNAGDPMIGRDYELFAVLAGVRNDYGITPISEPRGMPEDSCSEIDAYSEKFGIDGHSHSWLTLEELRSFNPKQTIFDNNLVIARNNAGRVTETAGWTNREHFGPVGSRQVFDLWGSQHWERVMRQLERVADRFDGDGSRVRLVFFFDN